MICSSVPGMYIFGYATFGNCTEIPECGESGAAGQETQAVR